eukprot:tig00000658_g2907.t1
MFLGSRGGPRSFPDGVILVELLEAKDTRGAAVTAQCLLADLPPQPLVQKGPAVGFPISGDAARNRPPTVIVGVAGYPNVGYDLTNVMDPPHTAETALPVVSRSKGLSSILYVRFSFSPAGGWPPGSAPGRRPPSPPLYPVGGPMEDPGPAQYTLLPRGNSPPPSPRTHLGRSAAAGPRLGTGTPAAPSPPSFASSVFACVPVCGAWFFGGDGVGPLPRRDAKLKPGTCGSFLDTCAPGTGLGPAADRLTRM